MSGGFFYFPVLGSTNDEARKFLSAREGTVLVADRQTKGKGRLGRKWFSPPGGLYFSVILKPRKAPKDLYKLTILAAVACARAIKSTTGLSAALKWPNDIMLEGKKVGGILTEGATRDKVSGIIIGVGINIARQKFPRQIRDAAASLEGAAARVAGDKLLKSILEEMEYWYLKFLTNDFTECMAEYESLGGKRSIKH